MTVRPTGTLLLLAALTAGWLVAGCGARFYNSAAVALTFTPRRASSGSERSPELSLEPKVYRDAEAAGRGPRGSQSVKP